ncbi:MAG: hypothetical protein RLY86_1842 [Pseudomonadota bacterium]|jgi:carbon-monoxide dehydrogenase medium subunit
MYAFDYHRPGTIADALALLADDPDARPIAGGQTLIPTLKQRLAMPTALVDLAGLPGLRTIAAEGDGVTIGAMATHGAVAADPIVRSLIPSLADLAGQIGDQLVRNRGTMGGSIANNDPAADYPAALLALDAVIRTDRRAITSGDFFTGMFETALTPGEIVTAVHVPRPIRGCYRKIRNPASRYALAGAFVAQTAAGVRVAVTGAAPAVFRWAAAEAALARDWSAAAIRPLSLDPGGLNSDMHAAADYRAHLVRVMVERAVDAAI